MKRIHESVHGGRAGGRRRRISTGLISLSGVRICRQTTEIVRDGIARLTGEVNVKVVQIEVLVIVASRRRSVSIFIVVAVGVVRTAVRRGRRRR